MEKETLSRFKKITGILVPVLVLVITCAAIGISFAWFGNMSEVRVSTLNLATNEVFVLTFDMGSGGGGGDEPQYEGQTAFDSDFHLVTDRWARDTENGGKGLESGSNPYTVYMLDRAFKSETDLILDTEGKTVDMNVKLNYLKIDNGNEADEVELDSSEDIKYNFTWYIKDSQGRMYTPYGTIDESQFGSNGTLAGSLPEANGITGFQASAETYRFCIVFCPEKIYWAQYFEADWIKTVSELYDSEEISKIVNDTHGYSNMPYYSTPIFTGATFTFGATVNVTNVY
jgi:hypothetical protein